MSQDQTQNQIQIPNLNQNQSQQQPIVLDMAQLKEAHKVIVAALNKSAKSGVFNLDEGYLIKLATTHFDKSVEWLEKNYK